MRLLIEQIKTRRESIFPQEGGSPIQIYWPIDLFPSSTNEGKIHTQQNKVTENVHVICFDSPIISYLIDPKENKETNNGKTKNKDNSSDNNNDSTPDQIIDQVKQLKQRLTTLTEEEQKLKQQER